MTRKSGRQTPQQLASSYRKFWREVRSVLDVKGQDDSNNIQHGQEGALATIFVLDEKPLRIRDLLVLGERKHEHFDIIVAFKAFVDQDQDVLVGATTSLTYVEAQRTGERSEPGERNLHVGLRFDYDRDGRTGHPRFHLQHEPIDLPEGVCNRPKRVDIPRVPIAPMALQDAMMMVVYDAGRDPSKLREVCRDERLPKFSDMLCAFHWYPDAR